MIVEFSDCNKSNFMKGPWRESHAVWINELWCYLSANRDAGTYIDHDKWIVGINKICRSIFVSFPSDSYRIKHIITWHNRSSLMCSLIIMSVYLTEIRVFWLIDIIVFCSCKHFSDFAAFKIWSFLMANKNVIQRFTHLTDTLLFKLHHLASWFINCDLEWLYHYHLLTRHWYTSITLCCKNPWVPMQNMVYTLPAGTRMGFVNQLTSIKLIKRDQAQNSQIPLKHGL